MDTDCTPRGIIRQNRKKTVTHKNGKDNLESVRIFDKILSRYFSLSKSLNQCARRRICNYSRPTVVKLLHCYDMPNIKTVLLELKIGLSSVFGFI